jgi:hypothetical protein
MQGINYFFSSLFPVKDLQYLMNCKGNNRKSTLCKFICTRMGNILVKFLRNVRVEFTLHSFQAFKFRCRKALRQLESSFVCAFSFLRIRNKNYSIAKIKEKAKATFKASIFFRNFRVNLICHTLSEIVKQLVNINLYLVSKNFAKMLVYRLYYKQKIWLRLLF